MKVAEQKLQNEACRMQDASSRMWAGDGQAQAAASPLSGTATGEFSLGFLFWVAKTSSREWVFPQTALTFVSGLSLKHSKRTTQLASCQAEGTV